MCYFCAPARDGYSTDYYGADSSTESGGQNSRGSVSANASSRSGEPSAPAARGQAASPQNTAGGTSYPNYIDGIMSGYRWEFVDGTRTITYTFQDDEFDVFDNGDQQNDWNAYEESAFVRAFSVIDDYINLDFANSGFRNDDNANFRLANYNANWSGWNGDGGTYGSFQYPTTTSINGNFNRQGTGWDETINRGLENGGFGFTTILHEIGHGLGLQHPFNDNVQDDGTTPNPDPFDDDYGFSNYGQMGIGDYDDGLFTVMSYNDQGELWNSGTSGDSQWTGYGQAGTLMAADIAALQRLYGARTGVGSGDTVYTLPSGNTVGCFYSCIYDTGGVDTITAFGQATAVTIDLRPGTYVSKLTGTYGGFTIAFDPVAAVAGSSSVDAWIEKAVGGQGDDTIIGNQKANELRGAQGADKIWGDNDGLGPNFGVDLAASGNDTIYGGSGADTIHGQGGDDLLVGEEDIDTIYGGDGSDVIYADRNDGVAVTATQNTLYGYDISGNLTLDGADTIHGGVGSDLIRGGAGGDTIYGNGGNDVIYGLVDDTPLAAADGADTIDGGAGDDMIYGEAGDDVLTAGTGKDTLDGGAGNDTLYGGDGISGDLDDTLYGYSGNDTIFGAGGIDTIYGDGTTDIPASLPGDDIIDGGDGGDIIDGGAGGDDILGGAGFDILRGGVGDDEIDGGLDGDTIYGGPDTIATGETDKDRLLGNAGADTIYGGAGDDFIDGGVGGDTLEGGAGDDEIFGGDVDNDTLKGDAGNDKLDGGAGDDFIYGLADDDTLKGGLGTDFLAGGEGKDNLDGGDGADALAGGNGDDTYALRGHETITEDAAVNSGKDTVEAYVGFLTQIANIEVFRLMDGNATVATGNALNNEIYGNSGDDLLQGLGGSDTLKGGLGRDTLRGGAGADSMNGEQGADTYDYDGTDTIVDTGTEGGDGVETSVSTSVTRFVGIENLTATGTANIDLTGDGVANELTGNVGKNTLDGDGGDDTLRGGRGNDTLYGRTGLDTLYGGDDNDILDGGDGNDFMFGESGDDTLTSSAGRDAVSGGVGSDTLVVNYSTVSYNVATTGFSGSLATGYSGAFFKQVNDDAARATFSEIEKFRITTGSGADTIRSGDGADTLVGGAGNDTLTSGKGYDVIDGGGDVDLWESDQSDLDSTQAMVLNLRLTAQGTYGVGGSVRSVDRLNLQTGAGADDITTQTSNLDDNITTNDGGDKVTVAGGRDIVSMGTGDDLLVVDYSAVSYAIRTTSFTPTATGYAGLYYKEVNDDGYRVSFSGVDRFNVKGGSGADTIQTGDNDDDVAGGVGDDTLNTGKGFDTVDGGVGNVDHWIADKSALTAEQAMVLNLRLTGVQATYGAATVKGVDRLSLSTGAGDDVITTLAAAHNDIVTTNGGADTVTVAGGRDTVSMGAGDDLLIVDYSTFGYDLQTANFAGSLAAGYSGDYFKRVNDDGHHVAYSGVERFDIKGGGANDRIQTGDGDDKVSGAAGADHLITGKGGDVVDGGTGDDRWEADKSFLTAGETFRLDLTIADVQGIYTGGSVKGIEMLTLVTGESSDIITTLAADFADQLTTNGGSDLVHVAGGRDTVALGDGDDVLSVNYAAVGYDIITANFAAGADGYSGVFLKRPNDDGHRVAFSGANRFDVLTGWGNDAITTGDGADFVSAGAGADYIVTGRGADTINGGTNPVVPNGPIESDRWDADKSGATVGMTLNLLSGISSYTIDGLNATVQGIEALGTNASARFQSGSGDDVIVTRSDFLNDFIATNAGADTVTVSGGRDAVDLGAQAAGTADRLIVDYSAVAYDLRTTDFAGTAADGYSGLYYKTVNDDQSRVAFAGVERFDLRGGSGGDLLRTGDNDDALSGGAGNDTLASGKGVDVIDGGADTDYWIADQTALTSGQAMVLDLTLTGSQGGYAGATVRGIEQLSIQTGDGADVITTLASNLDDTILTNGGADRVKVAGGRDIAILGEGIDLLTVDYSAVGYDIITISFAADASGYEGYYIKRPNDDGNRVLFAGVDMFDVSTGSGNDIIFTGDGADRVIAGAGADHIVTGKGADVVDGGTTAGSSTEVDRWQGDKSGATVGMTINLLGGISNYTIDGRNGSVQGVEALGTSAAARFQSGSGADVIVTRSDFLDDFIATNGGADTVTVAGGRDLVDLGGQAAGTADRLIVDYSAVAYDLRTTDFAGTAADGYSGLYYKTVNDDQSRVAFAGVERFDIRGGSGNDLIITGDGADVAAGNAGNDHLSTGKGDDVIDGGLGDDRWTADKSALTATQAMVLDLTAAASQASYGVGGSVRGVEMLTLTTGAGKDVVTTLDAYFEDAVTTGAGDDSVKVAGGRDVVSMGTGVDTLTVDYSAVGYDLRAVDFSQNAEGYSGVYLKRVNDDLSRVAFSGVDRFNVKGGSGSDFIQTGDGADTLSGGGGDDTLYTGKGADIVDGGSTMTENGLVAGADRWFADKSAATYGMTIDLRSGVSTYRIGSVAGSVTGVEALGADAGARFQSGSGADIIVTRSEFLDDFIATNGGADTVTVVSGRDSVDMGTNASGTFDKLVVDYSAVAYQIATASFAGSLTAGYSGAFYKMINDDGVRVAFAGVERFDVKGGSNDDRIQTGDGADAVAGNGGDDHLITGKGWDVVDGGAGADRWTADKSALTSAQAMTLNLTAAATQASYGSGGVVKGIEMLTLTTGAGKDVITTLAAAFDDQLVTGAGDDTVKVAGGRDTTDLGAGTGDLLVVDYSTVGYELNTTSFAGSLAAGYSGLLYKRVNDDGYRVEFAGVERFDVKGGSAGDRIETGDGADKVAGNAGNDDLITGKGWDVVDGGLGDDRWTADASALTAAQAFVLDLRKTAVQGVYGVGGSVKGVEALSLTTGAGADVVTTLAAAFNDVLTTGAGDDTVLVAGGRDVVAMGAGTGDLLVVDYSTVGYELNTINFAQSADGASGYYYKRVNDDGYNVSFSGVDRFNVTGGSANDTLQTGAGADMLSGGAGADTLIGGAGADTYVVDDVNDVVVELAGGGIDIVNTTVSFTLGAEVDQLVLLGAAAINGTGNALANALTGNAAANTLDGLAGADTMTGLGGDDTYVVDVSTDVVVEAANGGVDTVRSTATYTLSANVEALVLLGSTSISATGNTLDNTLTGNDNINVLNGLGGSDTMTGGLGNDTYVVDVATDKVIELSGGGTDTIVSSVTFTLADEVERLTLTGANAINATGNGLANRLTGNDAANTLNGLAGADMMTGGLGDDAYVVDDIGDSVIEAAGGGLDRVQSSVTFTLSAEVEELTLTGVAAINGTGNASGNVLTGGAGANALDGKDGADTLNGGLGADVLTGGIGADFFDFTTLLGGANVDRIVDFSVADDTIRIDNAIFATLAEGQLAVNAFALGAGAASQSTRIIYEGATGDLFFDQDGPGGGGAIKFATIGLNLGLTNQDFVVV